jgi:serine protease Do
VNHRIGVANHLSASEIRRVAQDEREDGMMTRAGWRWGTIGLAVVGLTTLVGSRNALWSGTLASSSQGAVMGSAQAAPPEPEALQEAFIRIARQAGPAVVSISTEQMEQVREWFRTHPFLGEDPFEEFFRQFYGDAPQRRRFGLGSGVIIDERGFILTNEHVVADADKITVTLSDGREFVGTVKGKDPRSDLAVIKIDADRLTVATLGDSATVVTGQWAVALGNPFGLMGVGPSVQALGTEPTLTVGVISALNRQLPRMSRYDRDYSDLIQTDAAINPGNSGGPLLNLQGEVIGINVAILTSSRGFEGVGFAIPVNKAKGILQTLIAGKTVVYGWLGIQIQDITEDVAEYYGLADREGVLVYMVIADGPASRAGIKDGDIIKTFGGQSIRHSRELIERVSGAKAGSRIPVEIMREGKRQTLQVEIGERPTDAEPMEAGEPSELWRGLQVTSLSPETLERIGLPADTKGVLVVEVEAGSKAEQAGLRPGDIINEINRARIDGVDDYRHAIAQVKKNALVRTNRGYVVIKAGP